MVVQNGDCRVVVKITSPPARPTVTRSPLVALISPRRYPSFSSGTQQAFFASYGLVWSMRFCSRETNKYGVGSGSSPTCFSTFGMADERTKIWGYRDTLNSPGAFLKPTTNINPHNTHISRFNMCNQVPVCTLFRNRSVTISSKQEA